MVIQLAYAPGDKFQIGYKALKQESYQWISLYFKNMKNKVVYMEYWITWKENWTDNTKKRKTKTCGQPK